MLVLIPVSVAAHLHSALDHKTKWAYEPYWTIFPTQATLEQLIYFEENELLRREQALAVTGEDPGRRSFEDTYALQSLRQELEFFSRPALGAPEIARLSEVAPNNLRLVIYQT